MTDEATVLRPVKTSPHRERWRLVLSLALLGSILWVALRGGEEPRLERVAARLSLASPGGGAIPLQGATWWWTSPTEITGHRLTPTPLGFWPKRPGGRELVTADIHGKSSAAGGERISTSALESISPHGDWRVVSGGDMIHGKTAVIFYATTKNVRARDTWGLPQPYPANGWSTDGSIWARVIPGQNGAPTRLRIFRPDANKAEEVAAPTPGLYPLPSLDIARDGTGRIGSFTEGVSREATVVEFPLDRPDQTKAGRVVAAPSGRQILSLAHSPDGGRIAWLLWEPRGTPQGPKWFQRVRRSLGMGQPVSKGGTWVALSKGDGSQPTILAASGIVPDPQRTRYKIAWSPDGKRIGCNLGDSVWVLPTP